MQRVSRFLRQHVVALLALTLVVGGSAAFAAGTKLPKNSVASKQVKNNSLKGKDLKDGSVTGKDLSDGSVTGTDLQDGSVTGTDLANGTVEMTELADNAVDEVHVFYYSSGNDDVIWEEPGIGKMTFSLSCGSDLSVNSFVSVTKSPARGGSYGLEHLNSGTEAADTSPLVGAATVSRLNDVGMPVGGAGFGGSKFGFGQLSLFIQTPTLDVHADLDISLCNARGVITIDHKPEGSVVTRPRGSQSSTSCEATGQAYCTETAA